MAKVVQAKSHQMYNNGGGVWGSIDAPPASGQQFETAYLYESFEYATMPVPNTGDTPPSGDLWRYDSTENSGDTRPGSVSLDTGTKLYGSKSLKIQADGGGTSSDVHKAKGNTNYTNSSNNHLTILQLMEWDAGEVNRLRMWMKADVNMEQNSTMGSANFHIGTYLRDAAEGSDESETYNNHYYHYLNMGYEGTMWHQIIVDSHPGHLRGDSGSVEVGNIVEPFPSTNPGETYFDTMTFFYLSEKTSGTVPPTSTYFDGMEFYVDPADEDEDNIYGFWGLYNDVTDKIVIGFKRNKTLSAPRFDARYATSSFHANGGWSHGDPAPNGTGFAGYTDNSNAGYNGVEYREGGFDFTGLDFIYIAIKYQGEATKFREIRIPLTAAGYPTLPTEPATLPGIP